MNRRSEEEEEEGNGWLKSDWEQGGWVLKQPEEKEENYRWNPKDEEREEEETLKGRLEIEDRQQGEYNLTVQDRYSSYFSNFISSSSQKNENETRNTMQEGES